MGSNILKFTDWVAALSVNEEVDSGNIFTTFIIIYYIIIKVKPFCVIFRINLIIHSVKKVSRIATSQYGFFNLKINGVQLQHRIITDKKGVDELCSNS